MKRKIDKQKRLRIPKEFLDYLELASGQEVAITMKKETIRIKRIKSNKKACIAKIRKIDSRNRIFIPAEYLKLLDIQPDSIVIVKLKKKSIRIYKDLKI